MKALIFDGTVPRLDANRPPPQPANGDAMVRVVKAAVGPTDLEVCQGLNGFRGVLGSEFVGVVEAVHGPTPGKPGGDRSTNLVGKRVAGSAIVVCGACDMCQAGLSRHCRNRTIAGLLGRDGCLAEWLALPAQNLTAVPDALDNDHAVFASHVASAIQVAQQLTIVGRPYITVLGDTSLGLIMAQVMGKLNASVRLVGWNADKLALCEKWGIKQRDVNDVGRRADQDIVVDCTYSPEGLSLAMQLVRPRGKIVMKSLLAPRSAGTHVPDLAAVVLNEIELVGSHAGPIGEAITSLARGEVDVVSLISRRMNLSDGPAILKAAAQPNVIKILVDP